MTQVEVKRMVQTFLGVKVNKTIPVGSREVSRTQTLLHVSFRLTSYDSFPGHSMLGDMVMMMVMMVLVMVVLGRLY